MTVLLLAVAVMSSFLQAASLASVEGRVVIVEGSLKTLDAAVIPMR